VTNEPLSLQVDAGSMGGPPERHAFLVMAHTDPYVLRILLALIDVRETTSSFTWTRSPTISTWLLS
jgi:hypothetical protein